MTDDRLLRKQPDYGKDSVFNTLALLLDNRETAGENRVLSILEDIFEPSGPFKGNIYFSDLGDLIQEVKQRLAHQKQGK